MEFLISVVEGKVNTIEEWINVLNYNCVTVTYSILILELRHAYKLRNNLSDLNNGWYNNKIKNNIILKNINQKLKLLKKLEKKGDKKRTQK